MSTATTAPGLKPRRRILAITLGAIVVVLALSFLARALENKTSSEASPAEGIFERTNITRNDLGIASLDEDGALTKAARAYAESIARSGVFDHVDAEGRDPQQRAERAGYKGAAVVLENLASGNGEPDARVVMASWLASQPHRENLLSSDATDLGVACATSASGFVCVQELGAKAIAK
jgi:uncharacterized protein YkwD